MKLILRFVCLLSLFALGCKASNSSTPTVRGKPVVAVVNYPLKYFAERIGGDAIEVSFPIPAEEDPDFWKPNESDIESYQKSDLILLNGAGYGQWISKATLPLAKCVDTSSAFKSKFIEIKDGVTHSHGPAGEHTHAGTASLTWLDFQQALLQAKAVCDALTKLSPTRKEEFEKRYLALEKELLELDALLEAKTRRIADRPLIGSHPVFQYLARRYRLKMESVHFEAEGMPDAKALEELTKLLKNHPAKWIIWEDTPNPETVKKLESMGLKSVVFLTTGNTPEKGDFLSQMRQNVENLEPLNGE
jgi:zinc transport system substrate-binding protein